jgi:hypothetical protein
MQLRQSLWVAGLFLTGVRLHDTDCPRVLALFDPAIGLPVLASDMPAYPCIDSQFRMLPAMGACFGL